MNDCENTPAWGRGSLPDCAPLAAAYIPVQPSSLPRYSPQDGLTRGTLFPGLDLPLLDEVNQESPYAGTPLGELMALDFVTKELNLYLDTHPDDKEAFAFLQEMLGLLETGKSVYVKKYGPVTLNCLQTQKSYTWVNGPWPWQEGESD